jgi:hypothetical protein
MHMRSVSATMARLVSALYYSALVARVSSWQWTAWKHAYLAPSMEIVYSVDVP